MNLLLIASIKLLFIASIWCDAKSDAVIDETKHRNHLLEVLSIAFLMAFLVPLYFLKFDFWLITKMVLSYVLLRAGMFNPLYNRFRNLDIQYLGKTEQFFDRIMSKFPFITFIYFLLFAAGLFLH